MLPIYSSLLHAMRMVLKTHHSIDTHVHRHSINNSKSAHVFVIISCLPLLTLDSVSLSLQDMFLIGATGPMRRWLALRFCEALQREVEVQSLTRDTTEADLKQVSVAAVPSLDYRNGLCGRHCNQQRGRLHQVQDLL